MIFFRLNTGVLLLSLAVVMFGATLVGLAFGRRLGRRSSHLREPFGILQGALIGFMGLVLAFGLSLAVGRYEARRGAVVAEANAIGTTYLRAQTLPEPLRTQSLVLLRDYARVELRLWSTVPGSAAARRTLAEGGDLQRRLWALAGASLAGAPEATAPRLYVDSLNSMIDAQGVRTAALGDRVPTTVLLLEVVGAAFALGL